jgi:hypothetical protein
MPLPSYEKSNKARIVTEQHHILLPLYRQSQKNLSLNPIRISPCYIHSLVFYLQHYPKKGLSNFGGLDLSKAPLDLHTKNPWNRSRVAFRRSYSGQCGHWSTPMQDLTMLVTLYDMLSGLANEQQCSELAYNFMARGGGEVLAGSIISSTSGPSALWIAIFALLDSWAVSAANPCSQPQAQPLGLSAPFGSSFQNLAAPGSISSNVSAIHNWS